MVVGGNPDGRRLRQLINRVATGATICVLLAAPAAFFAVNYSSLAVTAQTDANRAADVVSRRILAQPKLWRYEDHRLTGLLDAMHQGSAARHFEIRDAAGAVIAEAGRVHSALHIRRTAELRDGFMVVGQSIVYIDLSSVLGAVGIGLFFGVLLASLIQFLLRILPLRAVDNALDRARHYQEALETRVGQLEEIKTLLQNRTRALEETAADLAEARDKAQEVSKAKSDFLAGMSHELRTPLNAIIGFSEIIKDETFGPVGSVKYREYAGDINASGNHLLTLISDVLDLSKVEAGQTELHEEDVDVDDLVDGVARLMRTSAHDGGISLKIDIDADLPQLRADARKLKQILLNLLSNAIKFTDAGGEVSLRVRCDPSRCYEFTVTDTGIGIKAESIPLAMSQFGQVRGDIDHAHSHPGTGIGLPLTKALVELHGGRFLLASTPGEGTTVTARFSKDRIVAAPGAGSVLEAG